ncbi:MAG: gliding motility lipoprotein GldD [Bacteroidota bacterium]
MKQNLLLTSLFFLILIITISSCNNDTLPKPKAQLRLEYPEPIYQNTQSSCPYLFQFSKQAILKINSKCWINIDYPELNASINITYRPVENNLKELFQESEKLTFNHSIKANNISSLPFDNFNNKTYGAIFRVSGNAASPIQFHLTDSTKHFLTGAVYFNVQPNYDSILPAVNYLEKDIKHLMESVEWQN